MNRTKLVCCTFPKVHESNKNSHCATLWVESWVANIIVLISNDILIYFVILPPLFTLFLWFDSWEWVSGLCDFLKDFVLQHHINMSLFGCPRLGVFVLMTRNGAKQFILYLPNGDLLLVLISVFIPINSTKYIIASTYTYHVLWWNADFNFYTDLFRLFRRSLLQYIDEELKLR